MSATALERIALFFATLRTRQGLLAREALGTGGPEDTALRAELAAGMAAEIRRDGTVGGGALPTIWRVHELLDLRRGRNDPGLTGALTWLLSRQGQPGAYGDGCDKARHAQRICQHFVRGFFSPAPPEVRVAPITFPNGKSFRVEAAARFAISCLGLRAVIRAGLSQEPGTKLHLDSLRLLAEKWTGWTGLFAPDVIVAGLHALALGGQSTAASVGPIVELIAANQGPEGLWPHADPFATLEALQATGLDSARATAARALPALLERQRADGSFGATAQQERALIALRALLWADPSL